MLDSQRLTVRNNSTDLTYEITLKCAELGKKTLAIAPKEEKRIEDFYPIHPQTFPLYYGLEITCTSPQGKFIASRNWVELYSFIALSTATKKGKAIESLPNGDYADVKMFLRPETLTKEEFEPLKAVLPSYFMHFNKSPDKQTECATSAMQMFIADIIQAKKQEQQHWGYWENANEDEQKRILTSYAICYTPYLNSGIIRPRQILHALSELYGFEYSDVELARYIQAAEY